MSFNKARNIFLANLWKNIEKMKKKLYRSMILSSHVFMMKKTNLLIALLVVLVAFITLCLNYPFEKNQQPQNFNAENGGGFVVPNP